MTTTDAIDDRALHPVIALARALIRRPSVTPDDAGCMDLLGAQLAQLGFTVERMPFGAVDNLWARLGDSGPLVALAGHTDVVPVGDAASWTHPPFAAHLADGVLHGRGAADMKGSLAAMIVAVGKLLKTRGAPTHGSLALLLTSDEEGPAQDGTRRVMETLEARGEHIDYCLVGEPSSSSRLGDVVRVGRRGSLNAELTVHGIQGHVAYPQQARNPIHDAVTALAPLVAERWDDGNDFFPPTSLQISNIRSGTGATNVIPATARIDFNIRFCTEQTAAGLQARCEALLDATGIDYEVQWSLSGDPFLTRQGVLTTAVAETLAVNGEAQPQWSTGGGTSDGRFIAPWGTEVVELGPCNATIHKVDEQVATDELIALEAIYRGIVTRLVYAADPG